MATKKEEVKTSGRKAPPRPEMPKYNAGTLAQDLGIEPSAVRVLLRKSSLKKPGAVWGWDTKSDYDAALKTLKGLQSGKDSDKAAGKKAEKADSNKKAKAKA